MKETLQVKKEKTTAELKKIAEKLNTLQQAKNKGRGVTCVKDIVNLLNMGDLKAALQICKWDHDKIRNYPDLAKFINKNLLDQKDHIKI